MVRVSVLMILFLTFHSAISSDFEYSRYHDLLQKYVHGKSVDYAGLIGEKEVLITFTTKLKQISPDSHPDQFKTSQEKLAYWINAYNAFILLKIIDNYPVESIKDINFIGFTIWLSKNNIGGEDISFKSLEDDIIRERFKDPRIHFAINCASASCPPLANEAYAPGKLELQLEYSTKLFINDKSNFYVDEKAKIVYLSSIFDWYESDFITWLQNEHDREEVSLLDYIKIYYSGEVNENWRDYEIEFFEYDWSLNDISRKGEVD